MRPLSSQISDYLLEPKQLGWPADWAGIFGREAELAVEIGFGNGSFLAREAGRRPDRNHVGVEISWASATRLFKRLDHGGLTNVRVLLADAEPTFATLFAAESLSEVFINHPCPWPKVRHEERRLLQSPFIALLAARLKQGAQTTIVTDHAAYAAQIAEVLEGQEALSSVHATTEIAEVSDREPTKYELKARAQGIPIHFYQWKKSAAPRTDALPVFPDELPAMPSLTLRGPHEAAHLLEDFTPATLHEEHAGVDTFVKLLAAYRRFGGPETWLVEALVKEGKLQQEFAIEIDERENGNLVVKLAALGRPHPTHGVKRAIWYVGDILRQKYAGLEAAYDNLGDAKNEIEAD